jgi:hypothetical protein
MVIYMLVNVYKSLFLEYVVQNHVDYDYKIWYNFVL